jgi:4-aminobutyrate aminotransferase
VADLEDLLTIATAGDVACMIAEPIQGVGGFATPPDGFFGALHKSLANRGILFIADEVQTGWGRTGDHFWGYEAHGLVPDMLTFAKGVGNGITLAGCVARAEIMDTIDVLSFSTFGGNPLSAAAGSATLKYVVDNDLQANAKAMGERFSSAMSPIVDDVDWIAELRGRGLMWAFEICHAGGTEPDAAKTAAFLEGCKQHGLLVGKGGLYGNVIRLAPMLDVTADELDTGIDAIRSTIADLS